MATDFREEFCIGSSIDPELYEMSVMIEGNDLRQIDDLLGRNIARSGSGPLAHDFGDSAVFMQADGRTPWMVKPGRPRIDGSGKVRKYECPFGQATGPYLPAVTAEIRSAILGDELQSSSLMGFWQALALDPSIVIVITEGGKKSLCGLSHGIATIALSGVDGWNAEKGSAEIHPDLLPFLVPGRSIVLAFDSDENPKTRKRVKRASKRLAAAIREYCPNLFAKVAEWPSVRGKGLDDVVVRSGIKCLKAFLSEAQVLEDGTFNEVAAFGAGPFCVENVIGDSEVIYFMGKFRIWTGSYYKEFDEDFLAKQCHEKLLSYVVEKVGKEGVTRTTPYTAPKHATEAIASMKMLLFKGGEPYRGGLPCTNGVLEFTDGMAVLTPHNSDRLIIHEPETLYDPDADSLLCDEMMSALSTEEQDILVKVVASSIDLDAIRARHCRAVRALILKGNGSNGKDRHRVAFSLIFGRSNVADLSLADFASYDAGKRFDLSPLRSVSIAWSSENHAGSKLDNSGALKRAVTGDQLWAEDKHVKAIGFNPVAALIFNTNDSLYIDAANQAIKSRFAILTYSKTFGAEADPDHGILKGRAEFVSPAFLKEHVCPALLNRVIAAYKEVWDNGIDYSPCDRAIDELKSEMSHLVEFSEAALIEESPEGTIPLKELYQKLTNWYEDEEIARNNGGQVTFIENRRPGDTWVTASRLLFDRLKRIYPKIYKVRTQKGINIHGLRFADLDAIESIEYTYDG